MIRDKKTMQVEHVEALILGAKVKGEFLRFPHRYESKPDTRSWVAFHCTKLDELGVCWTAQNHALAWINDVDLQEIWEGLFKSSFRRIATDILVQYQPGFKPT